MSWVVGEFIIANPLTAWPTELRAVAESVREISGALCACEWRVAGKRSSGFVVRASGFVTSGMIELEA
jgi:hypothetical protein